MNRLHRALLLALTACFSIGLMSSSFVRAQGGDGTPTPTSASNTTIHVVQRGENLFRIALKYGTTVEAIARANGITDPTSIQVGQRLVIPNASPNTPGVPTDYVIGPGDTLAKLAARFGTTVHALALVNKIVNPTQLYIGLRVAVQLGSNNGDEGIRNGWMHAVQRGENLYRIATRYHVSAEAIARANALPRESAVYPGQRLVIPGDNTAPPLVDIPAPFSTIDMLPSVAEQGRTVVFRINTALPVRLAATLTGRTLTVFSNEQRTGHVVLFGSDSLTPPGIYKVNLVSTADDGSQTTFERPLEIVSGGYPSEQIRLAPELSDLLNPAVTAPEASRVLQLVSKVTPQRYFSGALGLPCSAPVTSQFGTRRSYNGGPYDNIHTGTDFAGMPGAAIYAPAAGVVVLAEALNVRGNATIIDHGWGVYTGYWHQSTLAVKVGDAVQQGQIIGTVGSTGRVTGPHLHWEVFVGGVQVDPLQWVRQSFP